MTDDPEWSLLNHYDSQSEARVVESYLNANGIEARLLDTHTHPYAPVKGLVKGMRLIVRTEQLEAAQTALREAGSHLSIVGDTPPKIEKSLAERVLIVVIVVVGVILLLAKIFGE